MSKSFESFFNITPQSVDFCPIIDKQIDIFNDFRKNSEYFFDLSDLSIDEKIKRVQTLNISCDILPSVNDLILNMEVWFKSFMDIFNKSISKEKSDYLRFELETESIFFLSQFDIYKKRINNFKLKYEKNLKTLQDKVEELDITRENVFVYKNDIVEEKMEDELSNVIYYINDYSSEVIYDLEYLRFTNSVFRDFGNNELKKLIKIQLLRNKDEIIEDYFSKNDGTGYEIRQRAKDRYLNIGEKREHYY